MDRKYREQVALETIKITKQRYYVKDGREIRVTLDDYYPIDLAIPYDPETLKDIEDEYDADEDIFADMYDLDDCDIFLTDADSFEAARPFELPLVMNFANAYNPGGGFLRGALAQEECLCRNSTLYASITSKKGLEMYKYNAEKRSPLSSDYMIFSPFVLVFRDPDMNLLDDPYEVSVATIAAPNRAGEASVLPKEDVEAAMYARLRKFFCLAEHEGASTLILGAWGCGAFGNDTRVVAQMFYDLLFKERFCENFDTIVFAIYKDPEKISIFREVFDGALIEGTMDEIVRYQDEKYLMEADDYDEHDFDIEDETLYYDSVYDMPICNHTQHVSDENVGYVQGITYDGIPFEAEMFEVGDVVTVAFYLPAFIFFSKEAEESAENPNVISFRSEDVMEDRSVLDIGMVDAGVEEDLEVVMEYVGFLTKHDLIFFTTDTINGAIEYRVDVNGNELVKILITISDGDDMPAYTDLNFRSFFYCQNRARNDGKAKVLSMEDYR